jgi:hypothetical protein
LDTLIKSLTKKKVDELKKLYENKLAVYNELLEKSEKDLWKEDLNKFLEVAFSYDWLKNNWLLSNIDRQKDTIFFNIAKQYSQNKN